MSLKDNFPFRVNLSSVIHKWNKYYQSKFNDDLLTEAVKDELDLIKFLDNYVEEHIKKALEKNK